MRPITEPSELAIISGGDSTGTSRGPAPLTNVSRPGPGYVFDRSIEDLCRGASDDKVVTVFGGYNGGGGLGLTGSGSSTTTVTGTCGDFRGGSGSPPQPTVPSCPAPSNGG